MDDPKYELAHIITCAGDCKIKYSLRTSPTKFIRNSIIFNNKLNKFNNFLR